MRAVILQTVVEVVQPFLEIDHLNVEGCVGGGDGGTAGALEKGGVGDLCDW